MNIYTASSANADTKRMLTRHPHVTATEDGSATGVSFTQGSWDREVLVADTQAKLYGLVEVMDNNPLVCADTISVPGPGATLALIALAPLINAGLVTDSPVIVLNFQTEEQEITQALQRQGLQHDVAIHTEPVDLEGVFAASVMVSIQTPDDLDDIDALYDEQFGRSFYVRRDETSEWNPELVSGEPFAVYRLRISPDAPNSLLTIRLLADKDGKCGSSQVIHAMNVMCGFEESLGVS